MYSSKNKPNSETIFIFILTQMHTKYVNAKDALLAWKEKWKRDRQEDVWQEKRWKTIGIRDRWEDKCSKPPTARFNNFTPLTIPIYQVPMQIKDDTTLTWPSKLKGDLNRRSKDKYYCFHRDHGHDTSECYNLK